MNGHILGLSLFILTALVENGNAANILCLYPTASYSHQQPLLALSQALAKKGHKLTVVTTNPSKTPIPNHREVDISFMYKYIQPKEMNENVGITLQERLTAMRIIRNLEKFSSFYTDRMLDSPIMTDFIREVNGTKFDLIMYEALTYTALLGLAEITGNPPIIGLSTLPPMYFMDVEVGNPTNPAFMPTVFIGESDRMTFWSRAVNLYLTIYSYYKTEFVIKPIQEALLTKYFGRVDHTAEFLDQNKSLLIVSADLAVTYPKPNQPNTVYVGAMHLKTPEPLPQDLKKWIEEAEDGVIYFSLGSNMKGTAVDPAKRAAFIKAFSQFPKVRVLWKWESDERLPGQPDNVLTRKWIPQQPVLAHPKTRLFISQVGLQSFQEAISHSVPILGVPMFGDQDYNAKKLVTEGAGLSIEFLDINYENIYENLKKLLTNPSYKENMRRLSKIAKDKPMSAVDTAVWWVEYVIRQRGAPHLRPASLDLTWYQYYMLDIIGVFTVCVVATAIIVYYFIKLIINSLTNQKLKKS